MDIRVGYLDEDESDIAQFHDFVNQYNNYEFCDLKPQRALSGTIEEILNLHLDIIVVDYLINEYMDIDYTGLMVIDELKKKIRDFPCMLLTSHPDEALEISFDTNSVYSKSVPFGNDEEQKNILAIKIKKNAENYKKRIFDAEKELEELNSLDKLSVTQEERLIELDDFLEANLGNDWKTPQHLKTTGHIDDIRKLVTRTEEILKKLEDN